MVKITCFQCTCTEKCKLTDKFTWSIIKIIYFHIVQLCLKCVCSFLLVLIYLYIAAKKGSIFILMKVNWLISMLVIVDNSIQLQRLLKSQEHLSNLEVKPHKNSFFFPETSFISNQFKKPMLV